VPATGLGALLERRRPARHSIAEVDIDQISLDERRQFDPVGHYSRPDVFRLSVDTTARASVVFDSDGPGSLGTNRA
jgi:nitrilase